MYLNAKLNVYVFMFIVTIMLANLFINVQARNVSDRLSLYLGLLLLKLPLVRF